MQKYSDFFNSRKFLVPENLILKHKFSCGLIDVKYLLSRVFDQKDKMK